MSSIMGNKSTIKVTFEGETKRVQAPKTYVELLSATKSSFASVAKLANLMQHKFYFLDEDQELISISSQDDFDDNSDYMQVVPQASANARAQVPSLIFSHSATDAGDQLRQLLQQSHHLSESCSQSAAQSSKQRMMSALSASLKQKVENGMSQDRDLEQEVSNGEQLKMAQMVQDAVRKEVHAYCEENLPRMIKEALATMAIPQSEKVPEPKPLAEQVIEEVKLVPEAPEEEKKQADVESQLIPAKTNLTYSAAFLRENKLAGEAGPAPKEYPAGELFKKSYTLINDGEHAWPTDVALVQRPGASGDLVKLSIKNKEQVLPGEDCTFELTCEAPRNEGICIVDLGLQTKDGTQFGEKFQCSFYVPKPEEDKQAEEQLLLANRDKSLGESNDAPAAGALLSKSAKSPRSPAQNPYVDMLPQSQPKLNPKQIYVARISSDAIQDRKITDGLDRLFEMGFVNYDINLALLKKYGDFGAAAEHLCAHGEDGVMR